MEYLDKLKKVVCDVCAISENDISLKSKRNELVMARTLYVNYAVKICANKRAIVESVNLSLDDIRACKIRYENEMSSNPLFKIVDRQIKEKICSE